MTRTRTFDIRIFTALFFSLFITVTGVGIVVPLLPVYAHELGASGFLIGLLFSIFSLSRTVSLSYCGKLSDKKGRKPFILIGLFSYAVISLLFLLADSIGELIVVRFIQGIASGMIVPVTQAYVGDITPKGKEGLIMGIFNVSMFLGLSLGPVAGGYLGDRYGLDLAFISMGVMSFIGFLLSLIYLPSVKMEKGPQHLPIPLSYGSLLKDHTIFALFAFRFIYTACIGIIWSIFPVFADAEFLLSASKIGFLLMLNVFISGIMQSPFGYLTDRINKHFMVLAGGVITCYSLFAYSWADGYQSLVVSSLLFGVGGGIAMPAIMAIAVVKGDEYNAMGSVMALLTMAHSLGMFVGGTLAGIIMDMAPMRDAFYWGAFFMALGVIIYSGILGILKKPAEHVK